MAKPIVTHISTVHRTFDVRIFHKECKSLAKSGYHVNLLVTHNKQELVDGVHIIPLPSYKGRFKRMLLKPMAAFSLALKTRADLYHFHDPELIPLGIALKCLGKKVIYDVHEDVPSQVMNKHWIPNCLRYPISKCISVLESISSRIFDGVVASTPHISKKFLKRNSATVNINSYPIKEEYQLLSSKEVKKVKNSICYVGGISKSRGICELVEALEGTNIKLFLAGQFTPTSLKKELEKKKGWKNVEFFGYVSQHEVHSILERTQIGMCTLHPTPSAVNGHGLKLFEYMAAGVPVIASNFPYWEELFKGCDNFRFVNPLDPKAIQQSIKDLLSKPEKCQALGELGYKLVEEKYNWEQEKKKLIDAYKKLGVSPDVA